MSINVNKDAYNELKSILDEKNITDTTVRLFVAGMGWSGPQFNLSIDDKNENDIAVDVDDLTFVVEKDLVDQFGDFEVKFFDQDGQRGIYVELANPGESGCSGCSGGC